MSSFSTDLAPWLVVLAIVGAAWWMVALVVQPLRRIARSLDEIKTLLAKRP
jgi:hypothetical protein